MLTSALAMLGFGVPAIAQSDQAVPVQSAPALEQFAGRWEGTLERGGTRAAFALDLSVQNDALTGKFEWPGLGYLQADVLGVRMRDGELRVALPLPIGSLRLSAPAHPTELRGVLQETTQVAGEWVTKPAEGVFHLRRADPVNLPYHIVPVSFSSGDVTLAGRVYEPASPGPWPGVVFIHGSGDSGMSDGAFYADQFARAGIAALIYDKRGVGNSGGDWRLGDYEVLAQDAHAALQTLAARPNVNADLVGYLARSEGGWVAPLAVAKGGGAFLAAVSGPTVTVADEDIDHFDIVLGEARVPDSERQVALSVIRARHAAMIDPSLQSGLDALNQQHGAAPWFSLIEIKPDDQVSSSPFRLRTIGYDPAPYLKSLGVPSFWIYGGDDRVIPASDSVSRLMTLQIEPRPLITVLPGADHALATTAYPALPQGVQRSAILFTDWIKGLDTADTP